MAKLFFNSNLFSIKPLLNKAIGDLGKFAQNQWPQVLGNLAGNPLTSALTNFISQQWTQNIKEYISGPNNFTSKDSAEYGEPLPIIYGKARVAGHVIWSAPIKRSIKPWNEGYLATFAMALCEGKVDNLHKIWLNDKIIGKNQLDYVFYQGDGQQMPDPTIMAFEKHTPAYRDIAYIVIKDLRVEQQFIPKMSFEVERVLEPSIVCQKIRAINLLPSCGECIYDSIIQSKVTGESIGGSWYQFGSRKYINYNNDQKADILLSLDQMQKTLPNLTWINLTVAWFADNLDIAHCNIYPATENNRNYRTDPDDWSVANISRENARSITRDSSGNPRYGGTPNDISVIRLAKELKSRGYQVIIYPLLLVEMDGKPWRGRISGSAEALESFFTKYESYILHYANLLGSDVDGIIIGSEMKGLTSLQDSQGEFVGVTKFIALAAKVKAIMGNKIILYAADWSEYQGVTVKHSLDALWACPDISFVGIDAYFPLTDRPQPQGGFSKEEIINGWTSGEGWDYYYDDNGNKHPINDPNYAWKNLEYWWSNEHRSSDGQLTPWTPRMKKIWFTEFGFPSVDNCTNQPNTFYDPNSMEGGLPRFSRGNIDFNAQSIALEATIDKWNNSEMVDNMFVWTWDARPFPQFPDRYDLWTDGDEWRYGHWINGKINRTSLASVVLDIASRAVDSDCIDVSRVRGSLDGHIIKGKHSILESLNTLRVCHNIEAWESMNKIIFKTPSVDIISVIDEQDLMFLETQKKITEIAKTAESYIPSIPKSLTLHYINRSLDYAPDSITVGDRTNYKNLNLYLPSVLSRTSAESTANTIINTLNSHQTSWQIALPIKYLYLEPMDLIRVEENIILQIQSIIFAEHIKIHALSYQEDQPMPTTSSNTYIYEIKSPAPSDFAPLAKTELEIIELPSQIYDKPTLAFITKALYENWPGADIFFIDNDMPEYWQSTTDSSQTFGYAADALKPTPTGLLDTINRPVVYIQNGDIHSISDDELLNGKNLAIIGNEIIQFQSAEMLSSNKFRLQGLIRGKNQLCHHQDNERFVMLDNMDLIKHYQGSNIGNIWSFSAVTKGNKPDNLDKIAHEILGIFFKPLAPVHLAIQHNKQEEVIITWIRCTRINGAWINYSDVPLEEEYEMYELEIYNNNDQITRTVNALNAPSYRYQKTDFIADQGSENAHITIKVYQLSTLVGRGYPGTWTGNITFG